MRAIPNTQPYHTRRYRQTCFGAGHVHCPDCDLALAVGREDAKIGEFYCPDCKFPHLRVAVSRPGGKGGEEMEYMEYQDMLRRREWLERQLVLADPHDDLDMMVSWKVELDELQGFIDIEESEESEEAEEV